MSSAFSQLRGGGDLVPVVDRLRALTIWRTVVLSIAIGAVALVPSFSRASRLPFIGGVLLFVVVSAVLTVDALRRNRGVLTLTRVLSLGDSLAIVLLSLALGGPESPLRYLVILQAVEVTLLASFRTGLRLVVWQSLVVSGLYVVGHRLAPGVDTLILSDGGRNQLIGLVGCSWVAAITTASLAAANERELRRRRYDLEQLAGYHSTISEASDVGAIAEEFTRSAVQEFDAARVLVALPESEGRLKVWSSAGLTAVPEGLQLHERSLVAEGSASAITMLVSGLDPDTDLELLTYVPETSRLAAMPVRTPRGRGVVLVEPSQAHGERVERRVVSMLERYRDELESMVSNLWLIESLREAASTDALTGVANRGRLREALHAATQHSVRTGQPLCVLILDVDHFKKVNDVHGHAAGDTVLRQVAAVLKGGIRPYDLVARYGGEEFVVLMPGLDLADAALLAERLRHLVATSTHPVAVTISLGVARFDPAIDDDDHVVSRADELLYAAKQGGRNRVCLADQGPFVPALSQAWPAPTV